MKNYIFPICLLLCFLTTNWATAQSGNYIDSVKVIPIFPTTNDMVKAVCFSHYGHNNCELDRTIIDTSKKNYVTVYAGHYIDDGDTEGKCYALDTIALGVFKAGEYTLDYIVNTLDIGGYSDRKVMPFTVQQATGIVNQVAFSSIKIYPNPATDELSIQLAEQAINNLRIAITDLTGRCLLQKPLEKEETKRIDIKEIPAGAYTVTVFSDKQTLATQKLIKLE